MHVERMREILCGLVPPVPVVEITRNDERSMRRHQTLDALPQPLELAAAAAGRERQMHAYAMQRITPARNVHFAMQKPASFEAVRGNVLVVPSPDWKAGEDRVAVVPMVIHGITAVGEIAPDRISQEFVLGLCGPVAVAGRVAVVGALHFLQKDDIGAE